MRHEVSRLMRMWPVAAALLLGGCNVMGWVANGVAGGGKTENVNADYKGLSGHSIAVMVAAADTTQYRYPQAPLAISKAVSTQLADHLKGVRLMSPKQVIAYQRNNPYWTDTPYSDLIKALGVDRIVIIDLLNYRTHDPGDTHIWKGLVDGTVGVVSADAKDPDNFVYYKRERVTFPPDNSVGVVDSDNQTMQLGMNALFAQRVGGLFFNHEDAVK